MYELLVGCNVSMVRCACIGNYEGVASALESLEDDCGIHSLYCSISTIKNSIDEVPELKRGNYVRILKLLQTELRKRRSKIEMFSKIAKEMPGTNPFEMILFEMDNGILE